MTHAALLLTLWLTAPTVQDDAAAAAKALEGTWTVEGATLDGKEVVAAGGGEFVFAAGRLTMKPPMDLPEQVFKYRVDPSKKPAAIDFAFDGAAPPNAGIGPAVYELDGDTLKLCLAPPDKPRPTEIGDKGQVLFVLKRKAK
jgi:uncharacterized protein (TIGR03067 family)